MKEFNYFIDECGEYYFVYNNKNVSLGVLLETSDEISKKKACSVKVVKPVIIEGGKILEVVKDAVTGEYYNYLSSGAYITRGDKIVFNKRLIDVASAFYPVEKNKGVVSYNLYYANEISDIIRSKYGTTHDLKNSKVYNELCGEFILNKMREIINSQEKEIQKTRTK